VLLDRGGDAHFLRKSMKRYFVYAEFQGKEQEIETNSYQCAWKFYNSMTRHEEIKIVKFFDRDTELCEPLFSYTFQS